MIGVMGVKYYFIFDSCNANYLARNIVKFYCLFAHLENCCTISYNISDNISINSLRNHITLLRSFVLESLLVVSKFIYTVFIIVTLLCYSCVCSAFCCTVSFVG